MLFCYPQPAQTDFVEQFCENETIFAHLSTMFPDQPEPVVPWDVNNQYK